MNTRKNKKLVLLIKYNIILSNTWIYFENIKYLIKLEDNNILN